MQAEARVLPLCPQVRHRRVWPGLFNSKCICVDFDERLIELGKKWSIRLNVCFNLCLS
jgi:hypothetical protein